RVHAELEEAVDEARRGKQPDAVAERGVEIERRRQHEAGPEQAEHLAAADRVADVGIGDEAEETARAVDQDQRAGDGDRQAALEVEKRRQVVADRIGRPLDAEREQRREEGYPDHPGREDRSDRMAFAGGAPALGGTLEYLRIVGSAAYPEDQQGRQDARPEYDPPAEVRIVDRGNHRPGQQRRQAGAHGGAAMNRTERLAAVPRVDDLAKEHGADRPFSAEAQPLKHTKNEQLLVVLREARQEGEYREPQDRQLQDPGPAVAIAQPTTDPA